MARRLALACSVVALAVASCSGATGTVPVTATPTTPQSTAVPATTTAVPPTSAAPPVPTTGAAPASSTAPPATTASTVPDVLAPFALGVIGLDGRDLLMAIADEFRLRSRGLMHVEDLGPLDGMIFVWSNDTDAAFWMRDTVIPLDIAWFRADGSFVSQLTMVPCPSGETCPNYAAKGTYRFAVEMPAGTMGELDETSRLMVPAEIAHGAES